MVDPLQNKNRTDLPIITVKTFKRIFDQFDFVFLSFFYSIHLARLFYSGNKKRAQPGKNKDKLFWMRFLILLFLLSLILSSRNIFNIIFYVIY